MEIFKDIIGYDGYQVSNLGNIISFKNGRFGNKNSSRIIKPFQNEKGYLIVSFRKNGKKNNFKIHRLVAEAFIPNPDNKPQVNHINGIKSDNRVDNLEWCTLSENINHSIKILGNTLRPRDGVDNKTKKVNQYDLNGNFIYEFNSIKKAGEQLGISRTRISLCCKGGCKTVGGFIWKYAL